MQRLRLSGVCAGLALLACAAVGQQALAQPPVHAASDAVQQQAARQLAQQPAKQLAKQPAQQPASRSSASPIYGVTIPPGYRKWQLIAPAEEAAPLDELRVVLGNPEAMAAIERSATRFPDGAVLVKLAYKRKPSPDFEPATIPGQSTTVQVMVKDSRRYASTGGWGFGRFVNGVAVDAAQHQTCFACHAARVKDRDYVFTRFAP